VVSCFWLSAHCAKILHDSLPVVTTVVGMELTLLAGHDLPKDSILSVRAGCVRRQTVVANRQVVAFPQGMMGDSTLQIDILRPVGAAYMVMKPGEVQYKVNFPCGEIEIECSGGSAIPEHLRPETVFFREVDEYLETYELLQFVQALLVAVIKERPAKPFEFMARHVGSGYRREERRAPSQGKLLGSSSLPEGTMELSLLAQRGLPQDSIISVRAGAVRRQTRAGSGRSIRFPKISPDENPIRLDLLRAECSSNLTLGSGLARYTVQLSGNDTNASMSCEFEIKATQFLAEPMCAHEDLPIQQLELLENEAKEYLEANNIVEFWEALLRAVVREQPRAPYEYMVRHFACGYAGIDALGNAGRMRHQRAMSERGSGLHSSPAKTVVPPRPIEAIKAKAINILERQHQSKRAESMRRLQEDGKRAAMTPGQVEGLRRRAEENFRMGVTNGSLRTSLAGAKQRKGAAQSS